MILEKFVIGPLETNCYIFGDEEVGEVVVIDPDVGIWEKIRQGKEPRKESASLRRKEADSGKGFEKLPNFKAILATHGHFDHVGGVEELRWATGAPFLIFEGAKEGLVQSQEIARELSGLRVGSPPKPDGYFKDGEKIKVGRHSLEVIHTPGHSLGSMCLYADSLADTNRVNTPCPQTAVILNLVQNRTVADSGRTLNPQHHVGCTASQVQGDDDVRASRFLFSGDLLFKNGVGRTDLPGGDLDQLEESLRKISVLPYSTRVLPGHGPETVLGLELERLDLACCG